MKEIHFYANKKGNLFLFLVYTLGCCAFIFFYKDLHNKSLFKIILAYFIFILFLFNSVRLFILLLRKKPLLTITNQKVFMYNVLTKSIDIVDFKDISKFTLTTATKHRTEKIDIILKNYDTSSEFPIINQYILTEDLNVKAKDLFKILNDKLKNV